MADPSFAPGAKKMWHLESGDYYFFKTKILNELDEKLQKYNTCYQDND